MCDRLLGSQLIQVFCFEISGTVTGAVCEYDDGRPSESCECYNCDYSTIGNNVNIKTFRCWFLYITCVYIM